MEANSPRLTNSETAPSPTTPRVQLKRQTLNVKLTFKAPVLTRSSAIGAYGIDSPMARNTNGEYLLPRTLVKDCLRDSLEELRAVDTAFASNINQWFGAKSEEAPHLSGTPKVSGVEPFRARLRWSDFIHTHPRRADASGKTFRIQIDRDLGAAKEGAYQVIETPFAAGERVTFEGTIDFFADDTDAGEIRRVVRCGFRWLMSAGALKNIGFGQLLEANVEGPVTKDGLQTDTEKTAFGTESFDLVITPRAPFCLSKRRTNPNLFESESVIPGAALKGSLAALWLKLNGKQNANYIDADPNDPQCSPLAKHFHLIRFTHAFPAELEKRNDKRPVIAPYSLVKGSKLSTGKDEIFDVALCDKPGLVGTKAVAPAFYMDWKSRDDVDELFGRGEPKRTLQVRTSIERKRAKDQQLYAYDKIVPDGFEWHARVDLSRITDTVERGKVESELRDLFTHELQDLGKTKVSAKVEARPPGKVESVMKSKADERDGLWIVTLQTPALLCDGSRLDETSGVKQLHDAYQKVWGGISDGALELVRYFAGQTLAGGEYLHQRFQPDKPYHPYLLTNAGSVFVLKAVANKETEAKNKIVDWLAHGLPLPSWAVTAYTRINNNDGAHWTNNPFIRENGYGEIAVNLDVHWNRRPEGDNWHEFPEALVD